MKGPCYASSCVQYTYTVVDILTAVVAMVARPHRQTKRNRSGRGAERVVLSLVIR